MQLERYHREWAEYFLREIAQFESAEKPNSANIINYFCTSSVMCTAVWSHPHFEYKYLVCWLYGNSPIHKSALNVCTIQLHWRPAKRFIARANFSMVLSTVIIPTRVARRVNWRVDEITLFKKLLFENSHLRNDGYISFIRIKNSSCLWQRVFIWN